MEPFNTTTASLAQTLKTVFDDLNNARTKTQPCSQTVPERLKLLSLSLLDAYICAHISLLQLPATKHRQIS